MENDRLKIKETVKKGSSNNPENANNKGDNSEE